MPVHRWMFCHSPCDIHSLFDTVMDWVDDCCTRSHSCSGANHCISKEGQHTYIHNQHKAIYLLVPRLTSGGEFIRNCSKNQCQRQMPTSTWINWQFHPVLPTSTSMSTSIVLILLFGSALVSLCRYYVDPDGQRDEQLPCQPGYFNNASGATACDRCEAGQYSASLHANACECPSLGVITNADQTGRVNCQVGWYQDEECSSECKTCGAGRYSEFETAAGCSECAKGKYSGEGAQSECQDCPIGRYVRTISGYFYIYIHLPMHVLIGMRVQKIVHASVVLTEFFFFFFFFSG